MPRKIEWHLEVIDPRAHSQIDRFVVARFRHVAQTRNLNRPRAPIEMFMDSFFEIAAEDRKIERCLARLRIAIEHLDPSLGFSLLRKWPDEKVGDMHPRPYLATNR